MGGRIQPSAVENLAERFTAVARQATMSHTRRIDMVYTDSRAIWFGSRADDFRARANVDRSRYDQYLKLASAYDALAHHTERSSELVNRFVKPAEVTSAKPPSRSRLLDL
jgi:hypothetical protein